MFVLSDYKTGFGGKFGVQTDRVDKSAVGWEHHEKVEKHESQTGMLCAFGFFSGNFISDFMFLFFLMIRLQNWLRGPVWCSDRPS